MRSRRPDPPRFLPRPPGSEDGKAGGHEDEGISRVRPPVFFDWDRADLTDRARQIIADAAANARNTRSTRIEVSGHGVSRNEIGVQAFGESRPLVPTADNVREPQNRRVEIVLR
jgi:outer membrane protein OmpA-like peptidoglycan-associated protein